MVAAAGDLEPPLIGAGNRQPCSAMLPLMSAVGFGEAKRCSSALITPILVNCASTSSDGSECSIDQGDSKQRTSTASSCDAYSSKQPSVARISWEEMQKGHYKTGVRYCMETWPENVILQVSSCCCASSIGNVLLCHCSGKQAMPTCCSTL